MGFTEIIKNHALKEEKFLGYTWECNSLEKSEESYNVNGLGLIGGSCEKF